MKRYKQIILRVLSSTYIKYGAVILIGGAVIGFMDENSLWSHMQNKQAIADLKAEIARYNAEHERDEARLRAIGTDTRVLEKMARERYFMKRPDEDIFVMGTK